MGRWDIGGWESNPSTSVYSGMALHRDLGCLEKFAPCRRGRFRGRVFSYQQLFGRTKSPCQLEYAMSVSMMYLQLSSLYFLDILLKESGRRHILIVLWHMRS